MGWVLYAFVCVERLTWKPWKADPYLKETFVEIIRGRNSGCRLIFNSKLFSCVFKQRVKTDLASPFAGKLRNLHSALHSVLVWC